MKAPLAPLSIIIVVIALLQHRSIIDTALNYYNTSIAESPTSLPTTTLFEARHPQITLSPAMSVPRVIVKAFQAVEKAEGAGARVRRSIGVPQLRNFSPFLMLDHFTIGDKAGFPDHPHRYVYAFW